MIDKLNIHPLAGSSRARQIPRSEAIKKLVRNKNNERPVFAITFDPRLPSISGVKKKHYRTMVKDPQLLEVFPLPPLVAYRRQKNIEDKVVRSKIPPIQKCNKYFMCPFKKVGKTVKATETNAQVTTNKPVSCQTKNAVY